jgi:signal transduction histidine kinase
VRLTLPVSRNVLLIGVEALHNAAKHSLGREVRLELGPEGRLWRLRIRDDGRNSAGALPPPGSEGLGLASMRRRAEEIGARISWDCAPGAGVAVTLVFDPDAAGRRAGSRPKSYDRTTGPAAPPAA